MATVETFENEGTPQERENGKRQSKINQQFLSPAEWAPVEDEVDARYQRYGKMTGDKQLKKGITGVGCSAALFRMELTSAVWPAGRGDNSCRRYGGGKGRCGCAGERRNGSGIDNRVVGA